MDQEEEFYLSRNENNCSKGANCPEKVIFNPSSTCIDCINCINCINCKDCLYLEGWDDLENYDSSPFTQKIIENIHDIYENVEDVKNIIRCWDCLSGKSFPLSSFNFKGDQDAKFLFFSGGRAKRRLTKNFFSKSRLRILFKDKEALRNILIYYPEYAELLPKEFIQELNEEKRQKSARK